jgi:hypothetical protein
VRHLRADSREPRVSMVCTRLRFLDEAGINLGLTRLFGRAAPGQRVGESVPSHAGTHLTRVAALGIQGVSAPWVVEGTVDSSVFMVYLQEVLGPTLAPGDIVVMDNLSVHKVAAVEALLKG